MPLHRSGRSRLIAGLIVGVLALTAACSGSTGGLADVQSAGVSPAGAAAVPPVGSGTASVPTGASSAGATTAPSTTVPTTTAPPQPVAKVAASPAFGADEISPTAPVTITVSQGTITDLTVTNPEGVAVKGTLSEDKRSWTLGEPLGYGRTYTVSGIGDRHRRQDGADQRRPTRR